MEKPFQGFRTFIKSPIGVLGENMADNKFGILGIPFDGATSNRPGARFGPAAIREASLMLTDGSHPQYMNRVQNTTLDFGDIPVSNTDVSRSLDQITEAVDLFNVMNVLSEDSSTSRKHLVTLGGDHTITLGVLRSMYKKYGKLDVIHFDAHCDTWPDHFGDKLGHGTWVKNAIEEGLVDPQGFVSIGIRSPADDQDRAYLANAGGLTIDADMVHVHGVEKITDRIYHQMSRSSDTFLRVGKRPCYLSFDIDAIDPSQAPGTGTPEIAGLTTVQIKQLLAAMSSFNWVGMDVVEVCPQYDVSQITSLTAATIAWQYMSAVLYHKGK